MVLTSKALWQRPGFGSAAGSLMIMSKGALVAFASRTGSAKEIAATAGWQGRREAGKGIGREP
jgi:hypothetical protein